MSKLVELKNYIDGCIECAEEVDPYEVLRLIAKADKPCNACKKSPSPLRQYNPDDE